MEYINEQNLSVNEGDVGFDLNNDGDLEDTIALTIEYDPEAYPETNGYYGTYLDLYLAEFTQNLQWYVDNLDYAEDWTWFDEDGNALSDEEVAAMTSEDTVRRIMCSAQRSRTPDTGIRFCWISSKPIPMCSPLCSIAGRQNKILFMIVM